MILETIFFAATIILSLVFLYHLSPSSVVSNTYSYDLKVAGDGALHSLYNDIIPIDRPAGYPSSKLEHYLITNAYASMISELNNLLPATVMYNIYISNGTKTVFWCNSFGNFSEPLSRIDPVTISHCIVAIDPAFSEAANRSGMYDHVDPATARFNKDDDGYNSWETSDLTPLFEGYSDTIFDVILEMWYI